MKSLPLNNPPWFDSKLINLKNIKNRAYQNMIKNNDSFKQKNLEQIFGEKYSAYTTYYNSRFDNYILNIQQKIKTNPKYFWKYFNSKRDINGLPSTMNYAGNEVSNIKDISNTFSDFFQSVYKPEDISDFNPKNIVNNNASIDIPFISETDIMTTLDSFNEGCGPDKIPSSVFKQFSCELSLPLAILFNLSLKSGKFPEKWKFSKITPIFKSGSRNDITCYRGISSTSSMPKLFEAVICKSFSDKVSKLVTFNQHGFLPGRSTTTNLVEFTNIATNTIEKHKQLDVIHTDFSKAFDSCSHARTLESLHEFGFSSKFISWVKSYMSNRIQYVEIKGEVSKQILATSGVPQGSHLGPWFFIIFINGLSNIIKNSKILMYADDLKIFRTIENLNDAHLLQDDINNLVDWCEKVKLNLNINKCKSMSFHRKLAPIIYDYYINSTKLSQITEVRDLGVTFTHNMSFNKHIDNIILKANQMLGFIRRWTKDLSSVNCILVLYFAYVRSQLEYAVPVWNPFYEVHIKRFEAIQKKFLTFLYYKNGGEYNTNIPHHENIQNMPSYNDLCSELNLLSLSNRRKFLSCCFIFNIIQGYSDSPFILQSISFEVPSKSLRNHNILHIQHHRTNYGMHEPINSMSKSFNKISDTFDFNISKNLFKSSLKKHLSNTNLN